MSLSYKTPHYFRDFQCLADKCEDTCCQHWEIKLDKKHYLLLKQKMMADAENAKLFERYIQINEQPVSGDHDFAFILMDETGHCPMLGKDGFCNVHRLYGVQPLGNTCAFFPRVISRNGDEIEMSGALSCPEVVRRCLSAEGEMKYVSFSPSILPRQRDYPLQRELPNNPKDYYARYFKQVRGAMLKLCGEESVELDTRLYALATLAHRISQYYHKDCGAPDEQQLANNLAEIAENSSLNKIGEYLLRYERGESVGLVVVHSILKIKQVRFPGEPIGKLVNRIFADYIETFDWEAGGDAQADIGITALQKEFDRRRHRCEAAFAPEVERYLTRYLQNCLFREWFYTMPDSFTYVQMLLLRLAMLRFLIVSHPQIQKLAERRLAADNTAKASEEILADLEKEVVSIIYNFARNIDQNMAFLQVIYNAVSEQQMMNHDYSLAFIKI